MINNEKEIWRAHPDIVGIEVSTMGRVRTLDRVTSSEKMTRFTQGRILKQRAIGNGYLQVGVTIDGKWSTKLVHRLVAQTFLPNPDNLPMVNHKDCDRANNNVENLEFCTASYNAKYRESFGKGSSKRVLAINLTTLEVSRFKSQSEASRVIRVFQPNINAVIKGKYKSTGGYWFTNDDENAADAINRKLQDIKKIYS